MLLSLIPSTDNKLLGDVCTIVGGGTPDTLFQDYWDGDINWFTPTEIGNTKYVDSSKKCISFLGLSKSSAKLLPSNTVLLTTRATLGEMSILREEACTNQGIQSLIATEAILPEYIYYLQCIIKPWCEKYASGNTFKEISKHTLSKCLIPVPDAIIQSKFVKILSYLDKHIYSMETTLSDLLLQKKALLQQLFI